MLVGPQNFVFLASVINFTLYITKPENTTHCYITLDYNSKFNDTWPAQWSSMIPHSNNVCKICLKTNLNKIILHHKVRYIFSNQSQWLLSDNWQSSLYDVKNCNNLLQNYENVVKINVVCFSITCIVILLLCLLYVVYKCKFLNYLVNKFTIK